MSRHVIETIDYKWIFGWDQPLKTFFLQKHDKLLEEDERIVVWLGTKPGEIYEVSDLVKVAKLNHLDISTELQVKLYREKDDGV